MKFQSQILAAVVGIAMLATPAIASAARNHGARFAARPAAHARAFNARANHFGRNTVVRPNPGRAFASPPMTPGAWHNNATSHYDNSVWNRQAWDHHDWDHDRDWDHDDDDAGWNQPGYGYAPAAPAYAPVYGSTACGYGNGNPALTAYRNRLLARKANLQMRRNGYGGFGRHPYVNGQLSEINKKLANVDWKLGISGNCANNYGYNGYNGYTANPLTNLGNFGGYYGGYGTNPYYGQSPLMNALPMLGNLIP